MYETLTSAPVILTASAAWALGVAGTCACQHLARWRESTQPVRRARVLAAAATFGVRVETAEALARALGDDWAESLTDDWSACGPNYAGGQRRPAVKAPPPRESAAVPHALPAPPLPPRPDVSAAPEAEPHLFMRAVDHVTEFVAYQRETQLGKNPITGRWEARRSDQGWLAQYQTWARQRSICRIPDSIFLGLLADAAGVEKKRDRIKCPHTGRVLKNAHGTPLRATHYTIFELPPAARTTRKPVSKAAVKPSDAAAGPSPGTWAEDLRELSKAA